MDIGSDEIQQHVQPEPCLNEFIETIEIVRRKKLGETDCEQNRGTIIQNQDTCNDITDFCECPVRMDYQPDPPIWLSVIMPRDGTALHSRGLDMVTYE